MVCMGTWLSVVSVFCVLQGGWLFSGACFHVGSATVVVHCGVVNRMQMFMGFV